MPNQRMLVRGDILVTMDEDRRILDNGGVYVEGDEIIAVGDAEELTDTYDPDTVKGGEDMIVMPGFVNAHDHVFIGLTRSLGEDLPLIDWGVESVFPTSEHLDEDGFLAGARLCFTEMVKSGTTYFMDDSLCYVSFDKEVGADLTARAAEAVGIGGAVGVGGIDIELEYVPDNLLTDVDTVSEQAVNAIEKHNSADGGVEMWTSPTYPPWCTGEMYRELKRIADEYGTWVYSHAAEVAVEVDIVQDMTGKRPVEYLHDLGVLDSNCLLAHVIWVNDDELEMLKDTGTKITHQPICNQYLSSGVAPIPEMLELGIPVGLGIDDGGHTNQDFPSLMKHGALMHKVDRTDALAMTAEQILEMATIVGAKVVGQEASMGSLEAGKKANIILIDQNTLNLTPRLRPVTNIVYGATAKDVHTTIINGEVVMEGREVLTVDEAEVMATAESEARELVRGTELEKQVEKSHLGWEYPAI